MNGVEDEPVLPEDASASAGVGKLFEHENIVTLRAQANCSCESAEAASDHNDFQLAVRPI